MATFVTNIKKLRLVSKPTTQHIIDGTVMLEQGKTIEFGDEGRYETEDKSELEFLRNHDGNGNNPNHVMIEFWELKPKKESNEEVKETISKVKKTKVMA